MPPYPPAPAPPASPADDRLASVERAVRRMRDRLGEAQCLSDHAEAGLFSPFHFHRVFRSVTSVTPGRFLAALRMAEAQRMMIRGAPRVTDVCTAVGYSSLGTFTTQFTRLVGMSPSRFKLLVDEHGDRRIGDIADTCDVAGAGGLPATTRPRPYEDTRGDITGEVTGAGRDARGLLFAGLYPYGVPQDLPVGCAVTTTPGAVRLRVPDDGAYHLLAVWFDRDTRVADALDDPAGERRLVGTARAPRRGSPAPLTLRLRAPLISDPPIVVALPLLLALATETTRVADTTGRRPRTTAPAAASGSG
ncbi:helix-turn-helix domain-containing protein [Streptomyces sp. CB03234]|uniref:helix-turn-helix domain-containing protein n=1 Tax=Streptomyces sp. (strain CB03234) TaxID=1703937 RepID=UPI00076F2B81|nr:AraC family transcriptional regulator [Streptomyces sp. CB03234]AME17994.1 AraC family transcriptional regulator [Streptomyces sp. CB03234]